MNFVILLVSDYAASDFLITMQECTLRIYKKVVIMYLNKCVRKVVAFLAETADNIAQNQEILRMISEMRLFDDNLMTLVFDKNILATELILNILLKRDDLKVLEVVAQREYKSSMPTGRSITIDIHAIDENKREYDVEVQRVDAGADVHRARFHSSMVDSRMLKAGQDFKEIRDSYVIFISENDVMGAGLPLYHIERTIQETGKMFGDGSHILYVNGSYKDDNDPVGRLMHDFRCVSSVDMFYPLLAEQVRHFKETEGGRKIMCKAVEDWAMGVAEEKAFEVRKGNAKRLIARGKLTLAEIAEDTELPLEVVEELANLQPV